MKRLRAKLILFLVVLCIHSSVFGQQVQIVRDDSESPVVSVAKSTLYGGLAGMVVGLALMLVITDNRGDAFKWSFVGGTAIGLGYGIYHVASRPSATAKNALFRIEGNEVAGINLPIPALKTDNGNVKGVELSILSVSF